MYCVVLVGGIVGRLSRESITMFVNKMLLNKKHTTVELSIPDRLVYAVQPYRGTSSGDEMIPVRLVGQIWEAWVHSA